MSTMKALKRAATALSPPSSPTSPMSPMRLKRMFTFSGTNGVSDESPDPLTDKRKKKKKKTDDDDQAADDTPPTRPPSDTLVNWLVDTKKKYLKDVNSSEEASEEKKEGENRTPAQNWIVCMGNEAGDLDSIASSIALAWAFSELHGRPCVPLVRTPREDLILRPENIYAFQFAGITKPEEQLLTVADLTDFLPSEAQIQAHTHAHKGDSTFDAQNSFSAKFPSDKFALVDHNRLHESFSLNNPSAEVVAVLDHHQDEGLYPSADPRVIIMPPCGSCTSLVTAACAEHLPPNTPPPAPEDRAGRNKEKSPDDIPPELATLLLGGILIDTSGLKPESAGGKSTAHDRRAALWLAPRSTLLLPEDGSFAPQSGFDDGDDTALRGTDAVRTLVKQLDYKKKKEIEHLPVSALLRRDFKAYELTLGWADGEPKPVIYAGLSSVPFSVEWLNTERKDKKKNKKDKDKDKKDQDKGKDKENSNKKKGSLPPLTRAALEYMESKDLAVLGVLTSYSEKKKKGAKEHRREMAWFVREVGEHTVAGTAEHLHAGIEGAPELQAVKDKKAKLGGKKLPAGVSVFVYRHDPSKTRKQIAPVMKRALEERKAT